MFDVKIGRSNVKNAKMRSDAPRYSTGKDSRKAKAQTRANAQVRAIKYAVS